MSADPHRGGHQVLADDVNARWDRDIKRQLAAIQADAILRDLRILSRAWAPTSAGIRRRAPASSICSPIRDDGRQP